MSDLFTAKGFKLGYCYHKASLANVRLPKEKTELLYKWLEDPSDFLILQGKPGTGKTYFCAAILNDMWAISKDVRFYRTNEFMNKLRKTIETGGSYETEIERLSSSKYFILDDLGVTQNTEWQIEVLTTLIDQRLSNGEINPTVITTNLTEKEILKIYGERFFSRFFCKKNFIMELDGNDNRLSSIHQASMEAHMRELNIPPKEESPRLVF